MQKNEIILSVDKAADGTATDVAYVRHEEHLNRSLYIGPLHTLSANDTLGLYRTRPTPSGNHRGVAKARTKLTRDIVVPGVDQSTTRTSPAIFEDSFAVPVGMTREQFIELLQTKIALLQDPEVIERLCLQLSI